jgi:putative flippase GtrA
MTKNRATGLRWREAGRFLRFCIVGGAGFMVDAIVLLALILGFALNPILARVFSFGIAVLFTFELNRRWVFGAREKHLVAAFTSYLGVQCAGFLCNLGVYTLAILGMPPPYNAPLLSLVVASGFALIVNYTGAKHLVFGTKPRVRDSYR